MKEYCKEWDYMTFRDKICWIMDNYGMFDDDDEGRRVLKPDTPEIIRKEYQMLEDEYKRAADEYEMID